jgi:hypothetical protein
MNGLKLLLTSSALVLAAVSVAQADPAGSYKLAIGANTTCDITLAADRSTSYTGACTPGTAVAHWQARNNSIELSKANGELIAVLKAKDGSYTGKTFEDGRTLTLSADGAAVASAH